MVATEGRYPEKTLQLAYVRWYSEHFGYIELIDDIDGAFGSPVDSIGFVGSRPVLIEFKHRVPAKMVFSSDSPASSLELKIVRSLKALLGLDDRRIAEATSGWDRATAPLIIIAANSISDGALEKLKELADSFSIPWGFSLRAYDWDGSAGRLLYERLLDDAAFVPSSSKLPELKSVVKPRSKGLNLEGVMTILDGKGLAGVFDAFADGLVELGGKPVSGRNKSNLLFTMVDPATKKPRTVASVWPYHSDAGHGLLISYSIPDLVACLGTPPERFDDLPGIEGPVVGYLNSHRFLRTPDEASLFWKVIGTS